MKLTIEFDSNYVGKRKNDLREKLATFRLFIFGSIVLLFCATYMVFWDNGRVISRMDLETGYILYAASVIVLVMSPFTLIFTKTNCNIKGMMKFTFVKEDENSEYCYELQTIKRKKPYYEIGKINMIVPKKHYFILSSNKGKSYLIPYCELSKDDKEELTKLSDCIKQLRIKQTNNKES